MNLTDNAIKVLEKRYLAKDENGNLQKPLMRCSEKWQTCNPGIELFTGRRT